MDDGLDAIALRQRRARRRRRRLHQLPARRATQYDAFVDALLAGEKTEFKDWEEHALFRRLPADRGDGRARPRDAAPWADEAGRPDQSACAGKKPYAVVQLRQDNRARHAVQHGRLPDQAEACRAGRACSARSPVSNAPNSRGSAACIATRFSTRRSVLDERLRLKADPRLRFAGQITGCEGYVESAAIGLLAGRFAAAERLGATLAPPPATTAIGALARPHHRRPYRRDRRRPRLVPADERQFRPVPAARRQDSAPRHKAARRGEGRREETRAQRPRRGRSRDLARERLGFRGGVIGAADANPSRYRYSLQFARFIITSCTSMRPGAYRRGAELRRKLDLRLPRRSAIRDRPGHSARRLSQNERRRRSIIVLISVGSRPGRC